MTTVFEEGRLAMVQAFVDTGLFVPISAVLPGCTEPTTFYGDFRRPDVNMAMGAQSTDYEIHYPYASAPTLAEGTEVIVGGVLYRLRVEPFIDPARGDDGFWRSVFLTAIR